MTGKKNSLFINNSLLKGFLFFLDCLKIFPFIVSSVGSLFCIHNLKQLNIFSSQYARDYKKTCTVHNKALKKIFECT